VSSMLNQHLPDDPPADPAPQAELGVGPMDDLLLVHSGCKAREMMALKAWREIGDEAVDGDGNHTYHIKVSRS